MDLVQKIKETMENWLETGEVEFGEILEATEDHWDSFIDGEFKSIEDDLKTDPGKAYGHVVSLANFTGHAAEKNPRIIRILTGYIKKFIDVMHKLRELLGATSFSVSVATPFYLSLSLTFS